MKLEAVARLQHVLVPLYIFTGKFGQQSTDVVAITVEGESFRPFKEKDSLWCRTITDNR
jgi:hypothetical protein